MATPKKHPLELAELFRSGVGTGRPPLFNTPEKLAEKISEYFELIEIDGEAPTITGLILFCGFSDRRSFYDYEKDKPEFSHVTHAARTIVAHWHEIRLSKDGKEVNINGSIFMLKNLGYADTQTIEHTGDAQVKQTFKIGSTVIEF